MRYYQKVISNRQIHSTVYIQYKWTVLVNIFTLFYKKVHIYCILYSGNVQPSVGLTCRSRERGLRFASKPHQAVGNNEKLILTLSVFNNGKK